MENILQDVNRDYISLRDEEVRRNNLILEYVLSTFVNRMKANDPLFNVMFRRVFYGGSYYDGLRVGKPEEFDLDLLLDIPTYTKPTLTTSNINGFVHLQVTRENLNAWMRQPEAMPAYRNFERFLFDERLYLNTSKALAWMEGVVQRTLNSFPRVGRAYILQNEMGTFEMTCYKSGPALTLHVSGSGVRMDVDLVTCFVFRGDKWPVNGFRSNPFPQSLPEFFIVPKAPKSLDQQPMHHYWRLSFQEQERALMNNKQNLKPTIRLLKQLRNNLGHDRIASYYIKTVLLHIMEQKEQSFWNMPLAHVFMTVLREYRDFIRDGNIPYYWNGKNNLIGGLDSSTVQNYSGRLSTVIRDIENNPDRPYIVAKYLLSRNDYQDFFDKYVERVVEVEPKVVENNARQEQSNCTIL